MTMIQARRVLGLLLTLTPLIIAVSGGHSGAIRPSLLVFTLAIIAGALTGALVVVRGGHLGLLHRALGWFAGSVMGILAGHFAARLLWREAAAQPWYSVRLLGVLYALIAAFGAILIPTRRAEPASSGLPG